MTRCEFEKVVREALRTLPKRFRKQMRNVSIVIEDRPGARTRRKFGLESGDLLFGCYEGVPLPERSGGQDPIYPDHIILFQEHIERGCGDRQEMIREIRETVHHEMGHYFGLTDTEME